MNETPIKKILNELIDYLSLELKKDETKQKIQENIATPLMKLIYERIFPYLVVFIVLMIITITLSIIVCLVLLIGFIKNSFGSSTPIKAAPINIE